jgi:RNA recognition motif-containing protein
MTNINPNMLMGLAGLLVSLLLILIYIKRSKKSGLNADNVQIYIGNLPYRVNEYDLKQFFSNYGTISHARIVKNHHTGQSKGFAFLTFTSTEASRKALVAHGMPLKGRNMVVRIAKPRPETEKTHNVAAE